MQLKALKTYLKKYGAITPLQAWQKLGIYRLSARIHDLRSKGLDIRTETVKRNGKRYAKYVVAS